MKNFKTSNRPIKSAFDDAEPVTFKIDDDQFTAYPPTEGQIAYMMASQADDRDLSDSIAGILDFFTGILDDQGAATFRRRFTDRDDTLTFEVVQDVLEALISEWSDRPTKPSSASTTSRGRTGRKSTVKPQLEE